jgi:hypothetical protein
MFLKWETTWSAVLEKGEPGCRTVANPLVGCRGCWKPRQVTDICLEPEGEMQLGYYLQMREMRRFWGSTSPIT